MSDRKNKDDDSILSDLMNVLSQVPVLSTVKREYETLQGFVRTRRSARILLVGQSIPAQELLGDLMRMPPPELSSGFREVSYEGRTMSCALLDANVEDVDAAVAALAKESPDLILVVRDSSEDFGARTRADALATAAEKRFGAAVLVYEDDSASEKTVELSTTFERARGLAVLTDRLTTLVPANAAIETARALPRALEARRKIAKKIVKSCATLSITVAVTPIPLSDLAIIGPMQALMVTSIAYLSGEPWDRNLAGRWLASVGVVGAAGIGLRTTAQQVVKVIPGVGSVASAAIAGAGTTALGRSAMAYFLRDKEIKALPAMDKTLS